MSKTRLIAGLILCLGFVLAGVSLSMPVLAQDGGDDDAQSEVTGNNSYCLVCHQETDEAVTLADGTVLELQFEADDPDNFAHSLHTQESVGLGCADCHAGAFPHIRPLPTSHTNYIGQYSDTCLDCHGQETEAGERVFHIANLEESELLTDTACYDCHVTGYTQLAPDPGVFTVDVETCTECHASTVAEWERSMHGEQQLGCNACHYPHQNRLRFETTEALCLNCHDDDRDSYIHIQHVEQSCDNCHIYRGGDRTLHILADVSLPTGHDNQVDMVACLDCHESLEVADDAVLAVEEHPLLEAEERIEALEAQIDEEREANEGIISVRLIQGIVVGLAAGVLLVFGILRYFKTRREFD